MDCAYGHDRRHHDERNRHENCNNRSAYNLLSTSRRSCGSCVDYASLPAVCNGIPALVRKNVRHPRTSQALQCGVCGVHCRVSSLCVIPRFVHADSLQGTARIRRSATFRQQCRNYHRCQPQKRARSDAWDQCDFFSR
jgi:hypothetical protein